MNAEKPDTATPRRMHWRPFAAATILMLTAALLLLDDLWQPVQKRVVTVPCAPTFMEFNEQLELNSNMQPGELLKRRDYFDEATSAQEARLEQALAGELTLVPTSHFNVILKPAAESFAVVFILDSNGKVIGSRQRSFEVAYPVGKTWTPNSGRLSGDKLAVLPSPNLSWDPQGSASYQVGFQIPAGSRRLQILTGLREQQLDNELKTSLDRLLLNLSKSPHTTLRSTRQIRKWLVDNGFAITTTEALKG